MASEMAQFKELAEQLQSMIDKHGTPEQASYAEWKQTRMKTEIARMRVMYINGLKLGDIIWYYKDRLNNIPDEVRYSARVDTAIAISQFMKSADLGGGKEDFKRVLKALKA